MNFTKPYIEISVIESKIPPMEILTAIQEKFRQPPYSAQVQWKSCTHNVDQKFLFVEFESQTAMENAYNAEIPVYDGFLELLTSEQFTQSEFKTLFPLPIPAVPSDEIYLVLKYTTNFINVLRVNYQYIFRIASMLGIVISYEEIMDGFIFYHARRADYELTLLPLNQPAKVEQWLKLNHFWNAAFQRFFKTVYHNFIRADP